MKYKIILGILVLSMCVSLGVNAYLYTLLMGRQAQVNNILSRTIATWVREMRIAGYLLQNATTNIEVDNVLALFRTAYRTAETLDLYDDHTVYSYMALVAGDIYDNLFPYCVGPPKASNTSTKT